MENEINPSVAAGLGAVLATMGIFAIVIGIAWYVLQVVAYWKIFTKAGKPGWHSLIPVLNTWDEFDLSWNRTMAWVFLALTIVSGIISSATQGQAQDGSANPSTLTLIVGIVMIVMALINEYKLSKAFGKGFGFFIGLLLLNPIFKLILGFGNAQYQGRQG